MSEYTTEVTPDKIQESMHRGFQRLSNFRNARLMFLRNYTGQYYDRTSGEIGSEALNLIFNAIRVLLPTIVMNFPTHRINTPYLQVKQYAELLGLAMDQHDQKIKIRDKYRQVMVDALFTLGITKTGLAQSNSVYALNDQDNVDAGTIYTEAVDFDNFVVDPNSKEFMFRDARFMGDRITVPRRLLLESGLYKNDLVERLPRCGDHEDEKASSISMRNIQADDGYDLEDEVEIVELWVPAANAIVTVPGGRDIKFEDYLRVDDYYGVKEGPYTLLALTPPVPGNPLPIPMVGVWNDLHILANRMAKKIIEQAERQKDIVSYKRASADDAEELKNATDGEAVAVDDPDGVKVLSFGGQQNSNEAHLAQLQNWFNMMAANPEQIGGQEVNANSATAATILQQNAAIGLDDMKDLVYVFAADEGRRRAFYMHYDPLLQVPLIKREQQPAQYAQGLDGSMQMIQPPTMAEVQVILTPEVRSGDFMDFAFSIEPESMGRKDSKTRLMQAMDFAVKIMPAAMTAAQVAIQLGIPFSAKAFILRMAKEAGIDWMEEVFYDPEFQMQMAMQLASGPKPEKGVAAPAEKPNLMNQIMQNGQPANVAGSAPDAAEQMNSGFQDGANFGQQLTKAGLGHSLALGSSKAPLPSLT